MTDIDEIIEEVRCIERDRKPMDSAVMLVRRIAALADEIERLRADALKGQKDYCDLMARHDAQHNEIERLRRLDSTELSIKCYDSGYEKGQHDAKEGYESMLRDQFAKAAMQGLLTDQSLDMEYDEYASLAFCYADAMMKERRNTHD
jgi:hypothetical protein